jgi:hypothetical protein
MRPLAIVGVLLMIGGIIVLALRGFSYTKERDAVKVGPIELAAEKKGFVPPIVGAAAVLVGAGLVFAGRRNV